jgi:carboxypeptidase C (cathepsin A)
MPGGLDDGPRRGPRLESRHQMKIASVLRLALALAMLAGAFAPVAAQEKHGPAKASPAHHQPAGEGILRLLPGDSITEHSIDTAQGKLAYTATAGTLPFYGQSGEQIASVFYVAYVAKDGGPNRPVTFAFNGGPGAASAFLNLGLVGPRVLDFGPDNRDPALAKLRDNPDTWLRFTDLVLIDPIGTGWSRTAKPDDAKHFWNVRADADAMAKAVALYVARNNRAGSPKYLMGESYGGLRAAKTARALEHEQGIAVSGIVMLSPLLEGWLTFGDDGSALRAALQLPSLAAAGLESKGAFSRDKLAAAEKFATTDYLTTLAGPPPQGDKGHAFYERVAQISGLPLDVVQKTHGFITDAFIKTLHAGKIVSHYDANFAVDDPFPEDSSPHGPDPILGNLALAYGGAFASYARNELGFKTPMTYQLLADDVTRQWDWEGGRAQVDAEGDLRVLLSFSPSFRLLVAHGYSDMVTPFAMTRYVLDHLPPTDPPGRVSLKLYRGGHMLYLDPTSRKAFTHDAAAFYRGAE